VFYFAEIAHCRFSGSVAFSWVCIVLYFLVLGASEERWSIVQFLAHGSIDRSGPGFSSPGVC